MKRMTRSKSYQEAYKAVRLKPKPMTAWRKRRQQKEYQDSQLKLIPLLIEDLHASAAEIDAHENQVLDFAILLAHKTQWLKYLTEFTKTRMFGFDYLTKTIPSENEAEKEVLSKLLNAIGRVCEEADEYIALRGTWGYRIAVFIHLIPDRWKKIKL